MYVHIYSFLSIGVEMGNKNILNGECLLDSCVACFGD